MKLNDERCKKKISMKFRYDQTLTFFLSNSNGNVKKIRPERFETKLDFFG